MTAVALDDGEQEAGGTAPAQSGAKAGKRKLVLLAAVGAAVLATGAGAWWWLGGDSGAGDAQVPAEAGAPPIALPDLVVNLRSPDGQPRFLKVRLMLEPADEAKSEELTARIPAIIDAFQPFLRELRPEDIAGSAAVYRIKEELLLRANAVAGEGTVRAVLVRDLLQQ